MDNSRKLSILHILLAVKETSAPYNEHCLPWAETRNIGVCTYFKGDLTPPASIRTFEGDGSTPGFFRALKAALQDRSYDIIHVHSPHLGVLDGGFAVGFADGRVWYLSDEVPLATLKQFMTIAGAESADREQMLGPICLIPEKHGSDPR